MINDIFTEARIAYLAYLNEGGIEPQVDMGSFRPQVNSLLPRSSQLGLCPLAYANEKLGVEPAHPELLTKNQPNLLHLFRSGNQCAREWTQTMVWYAQHQSDWQIQIEVPCDDKWTTGTIDMILTTANTKYIIDWKRTDQTAITERATGNVHGYHNFLQVADYCRKMEVLYPHCDVTGVVLRDYRSFWRPFWMIPEGNKYSGWWNILVNDKIVDVVSRENLKREIDVVILHLEDFYQIVVPPYDHPLIHWQCAQKVKGTVYKARCPYWSSCWKLPQEVDFANGVYNQEGVFYGLEAPTA